MKVSIELFSEAAEAFIEFSCWGRSRDVLKVVRIILSGKEFKNTLRLSGVGKQYYIRMKIFAAVIAAKFLYWFRAV